ncbi:hypothetical protein ACFW6E_31355 [Streptomyces olivaceoviridis]
MAMFERLVPSTRIAGTVYVRPGIDQQDDPLARPIDGHRTTTTS